MIILHEKEKIYTDVYLQHFGPTHLQIVSNKIEVFVNQSRSVVLYR